MNDNRLHETLYLFAYTIVVLLVLSLFPPIEIAGFSFREISLFSDVRKSIPEPQSKPNKGQVAEADSVALPEPKAGDLPCPPGVTCIEDYSEGGDGLVQFTKALRNAGKEQVRIGFFGDSFIEGDILTASLRDTLQGIFGGRGPGLVPIFSEVARFRNTISASAENWSNYTIIGKYETEPTFGPAGFAAVPRAGNISRFLPGKNRQVLEPISLLYGGPSAATVRVIVDDSLQSELTLAPEPLISSVNLSRQGSRSVQLEIVSPDSINLYGVSVERGNGVYVDNLAMRGNSGLALSRIKPSVLRRANALRPYRLVVLQYGLNVVTENDSTSYAWYVAGMTRVVEQIRSALPDCSILIVSVSDRAGNRNGEYETLPGILAMRAAQRKVAAKTGIAFWDLFQAMGGENSIGRYVNHNPPLAGKDYTHLNFRGGKVVALKMADALLFEHKRHEVRFP